MLGVHQRDQIVKADGHRRGAVERTDAGDGIVDVALDQARDVHDVGAQARDEGFADQFGGFTSRGRVRFRFARRSRRVPDADVLRRQQPGKAFPQRRDGFLEQPAQCQHDLVLPTVTHDGVDQRQRIAADAARAAGALGALHVDDDAHQEVSLSRLTAVLRS